MKNFSNMGTAKGFQGLAASQALTAPTKQISLYPIDLVDNVDTRTTIPGNFEGGLAELMSGSTQKSSMSNSLDSTNTSKSTTPMAKIESAEDFVQQLTPAAKVAAGKIGTDYRNVLAQWGLETGWGKSVLPDTYNLGNIKAGNGWKGGVYTTEASEYKNGNKVNEQSNFRKYNNYDEAANDYASLIANDSRYAKAIGKADPVAYFTALQKGGYATDPKYVSKMQDVVSTVNRLSGK